jgi:hypothetical protein
MYLSNKNYVCLSAQMIYYGKAMNTLYFYTDHEKVLIHRIHCHKMAERASEITASMTCYT